MHAHSTPDAFPRAFCTLNRTWCSHRQAAAVAQLLELSDRLPYSAVWQNEKRVWRDFEKACKMARTGQDVGLQLAWLALQVSTPALRCAGRLGFPSLVTPAWRQPLANSSVLVSLLSLLPPRSTAVVFLKSDGTLNSSACMLLPCTPCPRRRSQVRHEIEVETWLVECNLSHTLIWSPGAPSQQPACLKPRAAALRHFVVMVCF